MDISIETEQIEESVGRHSVFVHAVHHQHTSLAALGRHFRYTKAHEGSHRRWATHPTVARTSTEPAE